MDMSSQARRSGTSLPGRRRFRYCVLAAALALLPLGGPVPAKEGVNLKNWIEGPVRYLALKAEVKAFKKLKSEEDRALFIQRFWDRRDPREETLVNEYRQLFWERVNQANTNFIDSSKPGWKTDRGKIHILYGPPTEVQEDINLQTDGIPGGGHGLIRWIYDGRPSGRMDLDAIVVVPFVRDGSGEYRVSYDPALASVFFDANAIRDMHSDRSQRYRVENFAPGRSELSVMLDLGKMQEVPPQEQVLIERVETAEAYLTQPIEVAVDRYRDPDSGETLVAVTVDISSSSLEKRPAIIARFTHEQGDVRILGEDSFKIAEKDDRKLAQGRLRLAPGDYELTVMVADPIAVKTGMHRSIVSAPQMIERMRFSDVTWVTALEPLAYKGLISYEEPFIVGPYRVYPRLSPVFRQGDTVMMFYEVYGATPPLSITYQIEGQENDGSWVALGQPLTDEQVTPSQGWEIGTTPRWPTGEYRIRVDVLDFAGQLISTQVPFSLEASGAS